jgi:hypothetical protein
MPTHGIIDNRKEKLVCHINRILSSTESARFAVGYFFLSGLESIAQRLAAWIPKSTFQPSGGNLLKGKARDVGALAGVVDGDAQDAAVFVHVEQRVLIQVACLGDVVGFELDVQRVGVLKVSYSHNLNDRSKNALCTVSPSGNSITHATRVRPSLRSAPSGESFRPVARLLFPGVRRLVQSTPAG